MPLSAIADATLVLTNELIDESLRRQKPPAEADATDDGGADGAPAH